MNAVKVYYEDTTEIYRNWGGEFAPAMHYGYWVDDMQNSSYSELHFASLTQMNMKMAMMAGIVPGERVLDAGCGMGNSSIYLQGIGARPYAITLVAEHLADLRMRGIDCLVQDYTKTIFPSASFDVVWALESACHAKDKAAFVNESVRLLVENGRVVIGDFFLNRQPKNEQEQYCLDALLRGWAIPGYWSTAQFIEAFQAHGFNDVSEDITENVMPSAQEIYWRGKEGYLDDFFTKGKSVAEMHHVEACVAQKMLLEQDVLHYAVVTMSR